MTAPADAERRPEPLGLTVHSLPQPGDAMRRQRNSGRLKMLLVLLVCAAPVVASYWLVYGGRPALGSAAYGQLVHPAREMPALQGVNLQGQPVALQALQGQWLLVVVGSGRCDAACEKRLFTQRQLREMLGRERDRVDKLWLLTDDAPVAPALQQALAATPAFTALRLPPGALAGWLAPAAGHALDEHLYIVDPMGRWMMRMPTDPDPARVKRDLERLLRASAGWDQPGREPAAAGSAAALPDATASPAASATAPVASGARAR